MTEQRSPYLHLLSSTESEASLTLVLGPMTIHTDDPAFQSGYQEGQAQYRQCHAQEHTLDARLLLILLCRGWSAHPSTQMWQTGYITGWLFALFTQATSTTAESEVQS